MQACVYVPFENTLVRQALLVGPERRIPLRELWISLNYFINLDATLR